MLLYKVNFISAGVFTCEFSKLYNLFGAEIVSKSSGNASTYQLIVFNGRSFVSNLKVTSHAGIISRYTITSVNPTVLGCCGFHLSQLL